MSGNFEGIKTQKFGVEVECTGLTRADAAKAICVHEFPLMKRNSSPKITSTARKKNIAECLTNLTAINFLIQRYEKYR